ncbi:MAG: VanZ family protein [Bacilli bacterium]|nr:VanZ family protein [Bacilli bacterium]MDD4795043.1 VanZ family protein [Bacilli bacterium]
MIPKIATKVIYELWPMLTLFIIVLITIRTVYLKTNNKPFVLYKELISLCFVIYALLLFELVTSTDFHSFSNNFIPFKEIFRYRMSSVLFYRNVIGNVILFLPFGFFVSYYCKLNKYYYNLLVIFITSFSIEIIQSMIGRSFDIDDIILNLIGGYLGYVIYVLSGKVLKYYSVKLRNNILLNVILFIVILILAYIIFTLYGVFL